MKTILQKVMAMKWRDLTDQTKPAIAKKMHLAPTTDILEIEHKTEKYTKINDPYRSMISARYNQAVSSHLQELSCKS